MKRLFVVLVPFLLLFLYTTTSYIHTPIYAQTPSVEDPERQRMIRQPGESETRPQPTEDKAEERAIRIERIVAELNAINARRTTHFLNVLNRLMAILNKLETRAKILEEEGRDISALLPSLEKAKDTVSNGITLVTRQKDKVYKLDESIPSPRALLTLHKTLREDLKVSLRVVQEGREAVQEVFGLLKTVSGREPSSTDIQ